MVCEQIRAFVEENDDAMHDKAFDNDLNRAGRQVTEEAPRAARKTYENVKSQCKYSCKYMNCNVKTY
jgi:hypothetical protein